MIKRTDKQADTQGGRIDTVGQIYRKTARRTGEQKDRHTYRKAVGRTGGRGGQTYNIKTRYVQPFLLHILFLYASTWVFKLALTL